MLGNNHPATKTKVFCCCAVTQWYLFFRNMLLEKSVSLHEILFNVSIFSVFELSAKTNQTNIFFSLVGLFIWKHSAARPCGNSFVFRILPLFGAQTHHTKKTYQASKNQKPSREMEEVHSLAPGTVTNRKM